MMSLTVLGEDGWATWNCYQAVLALRFPLNWIDIWIDERFGASWKDILPIDLLSSIYNMSNALLYRNRTSKHCYRGT